MLVTSGYTAKMTRTHNDSNVLCLGGKTTGIFELPDTVDIWLSTDFIGDRHLISFKLIQDAEEVNMTERRWIGKPEYDKNAEVARLCIIGRGQRNEDFGPCRRHDRAGKRLYGMARV